MAAQLNPAPTHSWEPQAGEPTLVSEAGLLERLSRHGVRHYVVPIGGSGTADVVRYGNGTEVNVDNIVLHARRRRCYIAEEALVIRRASLSCDTVFSEEHSPPIAFTRPQLTLVCVPCGMRFTVDVRGGVRNQGLHGLFRPGALTAACGLRPEDFAQASIRCGRGRPGRTAVSRQRTAVAGAASLLVGSHKCSCRCQK